jgi:polyhydroxybutyrate depolymerase
MAMRLIGAVILWFCLSLTQALAQTQQTLTVDGVQRTYLLYGSKAGTPRPLVLALHGNAGTGAQFAKYGHWTETAQAKGFAVVLPDGTNRAWNDGRPRDTLLLRKPQEGIDDVRFLVQLIERLIADGIADKRHIFVTGASNGGMMTYRLLCERADLVAAGAAVIANLSTTLHGRCKPSRPVPMLIMNGSADKLTPYNGKVGVILSAPQTAAFWATHNGCADRTESRWLPDLDPKDGSKIERIAYACPPAHPVVLYRVADGGHQMPSRGTDFAAEIILGRRNHDIEAADEIWTFFKQFVR